MTLGSVVFDAGIMPMITVGRAGGTLPLPQASNKVIATASISNLGTGLVLTNNNGYGLKYTGALTVSTGAVYSVANASFSNLTQGLEFSGAVTAASGFVKTGAGTLVLSNVSNSIGAPIKASSRSTPSRRLEERSSPLIRRPVAPLSGRPPALTAARSSVSTERPVLASSRWRMVRRSS